MAEEMRGALALQQEIEKAKFRLKDVNENIKKITGRDPDEQRGPDRRMMGNDGRGRERIFNIARRGIGGQDGPPAKRRVITMGGPFSRLGPRPIRHQEDSGDEEEDQKHTVQSSVVATSAETRTKSLEKQSKDREGMARNKRMFGMILGTLQRFKTEAKDNKDKDDQRRKLEKKLDDKAEKEKIRIRQETRNLLDEMRLEQSKIRRLEQKMELVQDHEAIELEMIKLSNFLCTKAKPPLFYVPKKQLPSDDIKLKDSVVFVKGLIEEKKEKMEKEIEEIMMRENEREERIRSRIAERSRLESGEVGEEEEEEEDHPDHEEMEEHEDDQKAIDAHKASLKENKENKVKDEPGSDIDSNIHGEDFTVSGIKSEKEADDDDIEMGENECTVADAGEVQVEGKETETIDDNEGGEEYKKGGVEGGSKPEADEEMQDGGMVNTVGGAARVGLDKDKLSRNKSDISDKSKKSDRHHRDREGRDTDRHRRKSGHRDEKSISDRDKRRSSDHSEKERRRSRSKDGKERHRHSKHHRSDKPKRIRHDSDDDSPKEKSTHVVTSGKVKDNIAENLHETEIKESVVNMDVSSIELPPSKPTIDNGDTEDDFITSMVTGDFDKNKSDKVVETREERERKIVMAEDGEDMEDEPADE